MPGGQVGGPQRLDGSLAAQRLRDGEGRLHAGAGEAEVAAPALGPGHPEEGVGFRMPVSRPPEEPQRPLFVGHGRVRIAARFIKPAEIRQRRRGAARRAHTLEDGQRTLIGGERLLQPARLHEGGAAPAEDRGLAEPVPLPAVQGEGPVVELQGGGRIAREVVHPADLHQRRSLAAAVPGLTPEAERLMQEIQSLGRPAQEAVRPAEAVECHGLPGTIPQNPPGRESLTVGVQGSPEIRPRGMEAAEKIERRRLSAAILEGLEDLACPQEGALCLLRLRQGHMGGAEVVENLPDPTQRGSLLPPLAKGLPMSERGPIDGKGFPRGFRSTPRAQLLAARVGFGRRHPHAVPRGRGTQLLDSHRVTAGGIGGQGAHLQPVRTLRPRHHEQRLRPFPAVRAVDLEELASGGIEETGHHVDASLLDDGMEEVPGSEANQVGVRRSASQLPLGTRTGLDLGGEREGPRQPAPQQAGGCGQQCQDGDQRGRRPSHFVAFTRGFYRNPLLKSSSIGPSPRRRAPHLPSPPLPPHAHPAGRGGS